MRTRTAVLVALAVPAILFAYGNGLARIMFAQAPARDQQGQATGTARITGRVTAADTGRGLRTTAVRIVGSGLRTPKIVQTDSSGAYVLSDLPPGRYTLSAIKPGYVELNYGQRRSFENGQIIELADKQTIENINIALPRGGVIVVHITDEAGEPMPGIGIELERYRMWQGERRLASAFAGVFSTTDDRGELRVYGLAPGDYYVRAIIRGQPQETMPAPNGRSYLATYYPGALSPADARSVRVEAGREVQVAIPMVTGRLTRVGGTVTSASGSTARATVWLVGPQTETRTVNVQPDGAFSIAGLLPGEYSLAGSYMAGRPEAEYARVPLTVLGDDITNLSITTGPLGSLRGRFVYDTPMPPASRPADTQLTVTSTRSTIGANRRMTFNNDGTFEIAGLAGDQLLRLSTPPGQPNVWYLKAVMLDGRDVTDTPINLDGGRTVTGVEVFVTRTITEMTGRAIDERSARVSDYVAVVFPEEREKWTPQSRFIAAARPDQQGAFKITGLPAGRYLAVAMDYLEAGSERDPVVLERLKGAALPITLIEGQSTTIDLKVVTN